MGQGRDTWEGKRFLKQTRSRNILDRMSGSKADLTALASRVEQLERRVGCKTGQPLVPSLAEYSTDLGNGLAGNDRVVPLLRRTEELETFLDPLFGESGVRQEGVRWSIVESQGERLNNNLDMLQRLEKMKSCLDGSKLGRAEELKPKMAELTKVQVEQREEGDTVTMEALQLVQQYNDIIASLTEAFIQADQAVTKAEQQAGIVAAD